MKTNIPTPKKQILVTIVDTFDTLDALFAELKEDENLLINGEFSKTPDGKYICRWNVNGNPDIPEDADK